MVCSVQGGVWHGPRGLGLEMKRFRVQRAEELMRTGEEQRRKRE